MELDNREVILWSTVSGLRCVFVRRSSGPPFEITIARGDEVEKRLAFDRDDDAATFAIEQMRGAEPHDS